MEAVLKETCLDIAVRYEVTFEVTFIEIGTDADHVHFLMQSVPTLSPTRLVQRVKSLTAREVFRRVPCLPPRPFGQDQAMGWGVLVERVLRQHGRSLRQ